MVKLYGVSPDHRIVAEELAEIKVKHDEEMLHQNQKWYEIFTAPRMAYRIVLGVTLQALQQLTGANYFFYYGTVIFKSTGINNSYVTQVRTLPQLGCRLLYARSRHVSQAFQLPPSS